MNTIHDEMNKRFDDRFLESIRKRFGRVRFDGDSELLRDDIRLFIQSEIDIAVKSEREKTIDECIEVIEDYENDGIPDIITNLTQLKNNG